MQRALSVVVWVVVVVCQPTFARVVNGFDLQDASIPSGEIRHGGPPRDGIPAVDRPKFVAADKVRWLGADARVLGVDLDGVARAYPVSILDRHEIVNDATSATAIAVTYCPLCGSGVVFEARGRRFGVSGLLYNSDVLLYDDETESLWSQLLGEAVTGPARGERLVTVAALHTTWSHWRAKHPQTLVLSRRTGFRMDYQHPAYAGYENSPDPMFRVAHTDRRYHAKEWVLGVVVDGVAKVYPFQELRGAPPAFADRLGTRDVTVHFDGAANSAWITDLQGAPIDAIRAYWFAWVAFHPGTEVFVAP